MELRQRALQALRLPDPAQKVAAVQMLWSQAATLSIAEETLAGPGDLPGRPARPELIHPARVLKRSPASLPGRAALLHAICHIEFNAINLALDAVWRFTGMPRAFYLDWLRVAHEEAYHFTLLREHLQSLEFNGERWDYGSFPAHDNLWLMCEKTSSDIVARMALVPRTLEARGLDATPQIQAKLRQVGQAAARKAPAATDALKAADLLDIILRDEIGHVAIGNRWYRWLCERDGLDPVAHYGVLVERHAAPRLHPPFNREARLRAGFSEAELDYLLGG